MLRPRATSSMDSLRDLLPPSSVMLSARLGGSSSAWRSDLRLPLLLPFLSCNHHSAPHLTLLASQSRNSGCACVWQAGSKGGSSNLLFGSPVPACPNVVILRLSTGKRSCVYIQWMMRHYALLCKSLLRYLCLELTLATAAHARARPAGLYFYSNK